MAALVTTPLERQFGQISGITMMSSDSSAGLSTVVIQFDMDRDIDAAGQDVQSAINAARGTLPNNLPYPPVYNKVNPADAPILTLMLTSETRPLRDVNDYADSIIAQKISQIAGVGLVSIAGNVRPAVRVQVNPAQLANLGLTMEDVRSALTQANVNAPKGSLNGAVQSFSIGTNDQLDRRRRIPHDDHQLQERRAGAARRRRQGHRRRRERSARRVGERQARRAARHPPPAEREHRADGRGSAQGAAGTDIGAAGGRASGRVLRPHDHDPRVRARRRVHAWPDDPARDRGHLRVPAPAVGDGDPEHRGAALAARHVRRDVVRRFLARQPLADGADRRDRFRRRRCDRHDREHRALHRAGQGIRRKPRRSAPARSVSRSCR